MKKLTILVDMDDTIEELGDAWISYLNDKYGADVARESVTDWDISKFYPNLTRNQVYEPLKNEDLWRNVKPKDGAVEYLKKLIIDGHDIYILTASHYKSIQHKIGLVFLKYFSFIPWRNVIIACNKQMIKGDVLIDDGVHNLLGGDYRKILIDAPHNRSFNAEENDMIRVRTWSEVYEAIKKIADEGDIS